MTTACIDFNEDGTYTVRIENKEPEAPAPAAGMAPDMGAAPPAPGAPPPPVLGNPGMETGKPGGAPEMPEPGTGAEPGEAEEKGQTYPTLKAAFTAIAEFAENGQMTDHEGQAASFEDGFNTRGA